jgi:hypothetical protein
MGECFLLKLNLDIGKGRLDFNKFHRNGMQIQRVMFSVGYFVPQ